MSNWIDVTLDVLAASPDEINKIEAALQEPCEELLVWVAKRWGEDPKEIAADVKALVTFKPTRNLGYFHPSVNKARRFQDSFKDRSWGVVWSHVDFVSRDFPEAIFLAEHWNLMAGSASRTVIRAGQEIRSVYDGNQRAQGYEWVLPNIFAPYQTEYDLGLEFGSLWDQWLSEMQTELASLKAYYGESTVAERPAPAKPAKPTIPIWIHSQKLQNYANSFGDPEYRQKFLDMLQRKIDTHEQAWFTHDVEGKRKFVVLTEPEDPSEWTRHEV